MPKKISDTEKKVKIVPKTKPNIGIDTDNKFQDSVISAAQESSLDIGKLESFTNVAQTRDQIYSTIDTMMTDSTLSAVLDCYTADAVDTNDNGQIVWCESSDSDIANHVTYLLESLNIDKNIPRWAKKLIKYGDLYLKLYRESDIKGDPIFGDKVKDTLNENVNISLHKDSDHYVHYVEAVANPSEFFELTKYGKTMGFIEAPITVQTPFGNLEPNGFNYLKYKLRKKDVTVYSPTDYVHACLGDNSSRIQEEVNIFLNDNNYENNTEPLTYQVKRGESLFSNIFKVWREMTLLENSILLSRVTKSAIVRVLNVEVGDMPKEQANELLSRLKSQIEQKSALDTNQSMANYSNPSPIENVIYVPTHGGQGNITSTVIGGDVDPKQLTDLDWFNNRLFGSLGIPKHYFGFTDDDAGFNGGKSLSIISSRYGKKVKYIQTVLCQAITDIINLYLLDAGYDAYVNQFTIRMQPPITVEELDRREAADNRVRYVGDVMSQLSDIQSPIAKLKILKAMLANTVNDPEITEIIQSEIDSMQAELDKTQNSEEDNNSEDSLGDAELGSEPLPPLSGESDLDLGSDIDLGIEEEPALDLGTEEAGAESEAEPAAEETLPSPNDLGMDMTQNF